MEQKTTLSQSIDVVAQKAQYDAACKKVLAEKIILAWIMKHTMKEYADYDVWEIVEKSIVGEPKVGETPVLPDETMAPKVAGVGVEDSSVNEGTVTYDIQFRAILPNTEEIVQMIINVEAQNDFYPGYPILKRGIYYCARMISSQYGTVFTQSHYEKIQKVYSVWICMNPPEERKNTINKYAMIEENVVGKVKENKEFYDMMTTIMVCLGKGEDVEDDSLLRLLDILLSSDTNAEYKKAVLENDFDIPMTEKMKGDVEHMCNLSDGVEQKGINKGIDKERVRLIKIKLEKGKSPKEIAEMLELTLEEVNELIDSIEEQG